MKESKKVEYITRMSLRENRGWTQKMITVLLENVTYKPWGNLYRMWKNKTISTRRYRKN